MLTEFSYPSMIAEATRMSGTATFFSAAIVFGVVEGNVVQESEESLQIGKSGWIHGSVDSKGDIIISGRVDGRVTSSTKIRLLHTAVVQGELIAPTIQIQPGAVFEGETKMSPRLTSSQKRVA